MCPWVCVQLPGLISCLKIKRWLQYSHLLAHELQIKEIMDVLFNGLVPSRRKAGKGDALLPWFHPDKDRHLCMTASVREKNQTQI